MDLRAKDYDYENLKKQGTGSHGEPTDYKIITCPVDKYQITIKLTPTNEFIEILKVKINKEFLSHKQKIVSKGFHDVDKFYRK